ncbi:MAG: hypothetical protein ABGX36_06615 [Cycloclasticus sp.]
MSVAPLLNVKGVIACSSLDLLDTQLGLLGQAFKSVGAEKLDDDMSSMKIKKMACMI